MSIRVESSIRAIMIADSISESGIRLSTIQVTMPKFLLAQLNTHRMFSRNAASSRAIPTSKVIERVQNDPVMPIYWGKNRHGMQATEECATPIRMWMPDYEGDPEIPYDISREDYWLAIRDEVLYGAGKFIEAGYHKQIVNRLLEPFMYVDVLITATEWQNFFDLRLHDSTQPEMREVARVMRNAMDFSIPETLEPGEWHLPYVSPHEKTGGLDNKIKCSVARCARVSYLNHDQSNPDLKKDLELYELLHKEQHFSPFEHQATPMKVSEWPYYSDQSVWIDYEEPGVTHADRNGVYWSGNFRGWIQNRQLVGLVEE